MVDDSIEFTENSLEFLVRLPSDLNDFDQARVIFDGHVVAHSDGVELINDNTVEVFYYDDAYVVYEPIGENASAILPVIIIVLPIGGIFYYIRKQNNKHTEVIHNDSLSF